MVHGNRGASGGPSWSMVISKDGARPSWSMVIREHQADHHGPWYSESIRLAIMVHGNQGASGQSSWSMVINKH